MSKKANGLEVKLDQIFREELEDNSFLHLAAAKYATDKGTESFNYRKKMKLKPFDLYSKNQDIWVAHYEGFKAGYEQSGGYV